MEEKIAVLALGGMGSRLKSIINSIPKPLYPVLGESTLYRACKQLSIYGIKDIIFTLQYNKEFFEVAIKEISDELNQNIYVFEEESPLGECGALWKLKERLSEDFLFINGDLVFEIDLYRFIHFHHRINSKLTLITHTSSHPHDSDLISTPNGTSIDKLFFKSSHNHNQAEGFLGNAGIALISKTLLDKIDPPSQLSKSSLFHYFVSNVWQKKERIFSYNTTEYIKDMGTPERLQEVELALKSGIVSKKCYCNKQKALFIDRDNTIIRCNKGNYILDKNTIEFYDQRIAMIGRIAASYDLVSIITNQPQIAMGLISTEELDQINSYIIKYCINIGLKIDSVKYCPHHPHKGYDQEVSILKQDCFCRKPNPGLLLEEAYMRNINLEESLFIGDSPNDKLAAEKVGCKFKYVDSLD